MADLDRYDLEGDYIGECQLCGCSIYDNEDTAKVAQELVHKHCAEAVEEELMALDMDWRQSE